MPKPVAMPLSSSMVEAAQIVPHASTPARAAKATTTAAAPEKPEQMPLQVRWPRQDVRAVKVAAAEREQTISDFMLACFHDYMKS